MKETQITRKSAISDIRLHYNVQSLSASSGDAIMIKSLCGGPINYRFLTLWKSGMGSI
jgi:hypothetical protein